MFYSKSTGGFYHSSIHGNAIPPDAVEISQQHHAALMMAQTEGKIIQANGDGFPVAVDPIVPTAEETAELIDTQRAIAYREKSDPIFFKYQRGEATKEEWLQAIEEVRILYPKE